MLDFLLPSLVLQLAVHHAKPCSIVAILVTNIIVKLIEFLFAVNQSMILSLL